MAGSGLAAFAIGAGVLALVAAIVVGRTATSAASRRLVGVLALEGIFMVTIGASEAYALPPYAVTAGIVAFPLLPFLYLFFLATLDTPVTAWLRPAAVQKAVLVVGVLFTAAFVTAGVGADYGSATAIWWLENVFYITQTVFLAGVAVFALVATIQAWRRALPGTALRARARLYAWAFGTRDAIVVAGSLGLVLYITLVPPVEGGGDEWATIAVPAFALSTIAFVLLLSYAILKAQLFDLDLRLKWGVKRGSVVALGIVAAFIALKAAEFYLSKEVGFLAGALAAGLVLFAAPRLNRIADKVADKAAPAVQPTPAYVIYRKLEVYRAAVESAIEEGGMTAKDRAVLARLRQKLGLAEEDATAVERDTIETHPPASAPSAEPS